MIEDTTSKSMRANGKDGKISLMKSLTKDDQQLVLLLPAR